MTRVLDSSPKALGGEQPGGLAASSQAWGKGSQRVPGLQAALCCGGELSCACRDGLPRAGPHLGIPQQPPTPAHTITHLSNTD